MADEKCLAWAGLGVLASLLTVFGPRAKTRLRTRAVRRGWGGREGGRGVSVLHQHHNLNLNINHQNLIFLISPKLNIRNTLMRDHLPLPTSQFQLWCLCLSPGRDVSTCGHSHYLSWSGLATLEIPHIAVRRGGKKIMTVSVGWSRPGRD